jgi:hypothetical protein
MINKATNESELRKVRTHYNFIKELSGSEISDFIDIDDLNTFTRERLAELYNDPSDSSYFTPQQLGKIDINKMIQNNEIGGALYNTPIGKVISLECDSDTYRLSLLWIINLDDNTGIIDDV